MKVYAIHHADCLERLQQGLINRAEAIVAFGAGGVAKFQIGRTAERLGNPVLKRKLRKIVEAPDANHSLSYMLF